MSTPKFSEPFLLLLQEGYLIHSCLAQGLTALRNAYVGQKGLYYSAFFQLSIGLERVMKAIIILDHMADNGLKPPTSATLKNHGHNLKTLFEAMRDVPVSMPQHPLTPVKVGSIEYDILEHLSDFSNGARYFNLERLTSGQPKLDPLARWNHILARIVAEDVPAKQKERLRSEAEVVAEALAGHARGIVHDLENQPLSLQQSVELPTLNSAAAPYAVYRVFLLLAPLKAVLEDTTNRVMRLDHANGTVPFMQEFLDFVLLNKQMILRKRKWP